jgi:hypothetical protein
MLLVRGSVRVRKYLFSALAGQCRCLHHGRSSWQRGYRVRRRLLGHRRSGRHRNHYAALALRFRFVCRRTTSESGATAFCPECFRLGGPQHSGCFLAGGVSFIGYEISQAQGPSTAQPASP